MDNGKIAYKNCWLTLNHACNLNCKWCYAKDTGYLKSDDMSLDMAYDIIDICHDLSINHITLIGGEPTIYPHLFDVIDYDYKDFLVTVKNSNRKSPQTHKDKKEI